MRLDFPPYSKSDGLNEKREKIRQKNSQTERGIYFRVDSVDKVDRGLSA